METPNPAPKATTALRRLDWVVCGLVIAATILVYLPSLQGGFLWDDDGHVCPAGLRSWPGLIRIWTKLGATQQYYPILHSAFWLEYRLWGETVLGYHLTNVLLHACSACLVLAIVRRLGLHGGWLAAVVFALHPVCVESVAWISEQKNTLSMLFALCATWCYLAFDESRKRRHYLGASAFLALALLTKSVTAMLPVAWVCVLWWRRRSLRWRNDVLPLIPWILLGGGMGLFTAWVERTWIGAQGDDFVLSLGQRLMLAGRIPWFYLTKLLWPVDLIFIYPRWTPDTAAASQYLFPFGVGSVLVAGWAVRGYSRGPFASSAAFLVLLFPVLGFVNVYPFLFSFVADHFQYLACLAVVIPLSAFVTVQARRLPAAMTLIAAIAGMGVLGTLTWRQNQLYRDKEVLYRETLNRNPDCWLAHNNLGNSLAERPAERNAAIQHYRAAIALKPNYVDAHFNLANSLAKLTSERDEAIRQYREALRLRPNYPEAHNNLGILLAQVPAEINASVREFEEAVRLKDDFAAAHANLATALAKLPNRGEEARTHYKKALLLDPDSAETEFNFANLLAKSPADRSEAAAHYEKALRLASSYAEAHFNLAVVLMAIPGRKDEAKAHLQTVLQLHPEWDFARRALERLQIQPGN